MKRVNQIDFLSVQIQFVIMTLFFSDLVVNVIQTLPEEKKSAMDTGWLCWWDNLCDGCEPDMFIMKSICTLVVEVLSCLSFLSWQF